MMRSKYQMLMNFINTRSFRVQMLKYLVTTKFRPGRMLACICQ